MRKFAIKLLMLAMFSMALVAAPVLAYAAPDADPPPASSGGKSKPKKKSENGSRTDTAFVEGYRAAYATKQELLDRFRDRDARLAAVVADKHADYFPRASPEKFRPYSPTIGHIAITLLVTHPPHHLGQLKQWRRVAGIAEKA